MNRLPCYTCELEFTCTRAIELDCSAYVRASISAPRRVGQRWEPTRAPRSDRRTGGAHRA